MSEITCPSGLKGRIRKMKVNEARAFTGQRRKVKGDPLGRLLSACWEETVDVGPYDFGGKAPDWSKVLLGDRLYVLMAIRMETHGSEYAFSVNCQDRDCRRKIDWELELDKLPVRKLTDENRDAFVDGNRFETTLPESGSLVYFRMLVGKDEITLSRMKQDGDDVNLFDLLNLRVIEIEGVDPRDLRKFIDDLSMDEADFLMDEFDRVDCGVDTAIEIECQKCWAVQEIELPFGKTFFMPGKGRQASKRGRSGSFLG